MTEWIITSSALIVIIIALRGLLKGKISLRLQYGLWALVLVRLLLPFSVVDSAVSVGNLILDISSQSAVQEAGTALEQYERVYQGIQNRYDLEGVAVTPGQVRQEAREEIYDDTYDDIRASHTGEDIPDSAIQLEAQQRVEAISYAAMIADALPYIWYGGMILVAAVLLISNIHFAWKLRKTRKKCDIYGPHLKVYHSSYVATPCLFGFFDPAIYLTEEVLEDSQMRTHVLAHEMSHYRHRDHIWSMLRGVCLVLHWYNPLVWAAAILSKRDAELACDEATIAALGEEERVSYGRTLIGMTCVKRDPRSLLLTATTMLGSKKTLKERVTLIAKKPKTALYTLVACILVAVIAVACTFTGAADTTVTPIDWKLYGTWITADGETGETVEFAVKGEITDYLEEYDRIDLEFTFFDTFRYGFGGSETGDISMNDQYDDLDYFVSHTFTYDANTNAPEFTDYAVSIEEGYMIFNWANHEGYFVASLDPNTDPAEILQYFQRFIEAYTTHDTSTDPVLTEEYPAGDGHDDADEPHTIWYVEPWIDIYADRIGSYGCEYGFLYLYDEDTDAVTQLCDATYETQTVVLGHVFFSSNGGQLTHYVPATGERAVIYIAENGIIRALDYFNENGSPVLYLLDGDRLVRYGLLTGEASEIGVFEGAEDVCVSPANPDLVAVSALYGWTILDLTTGETAYVESEDGFFTFYNDGIMPESEPVGSVDPYPGIDSPSEPATELPTEPSNPEDIAYFQELLSTHNYWYWRIMSCTFADPKEISMEHMFYTGLAQEDRQVWSEFTDEEVAFLQDWLRGTIWEEGQWTNAQKMPASGIDEALREYLGISLADVTIPEDWTYYQETDSYYAVHTDAFGVIGTQVTAVDRGEDGIIRVYWTIGFMLNTSTGEYMENPLMVTTLQEKDDGGYYVLSNVPA